MIGFTSGSTGEPQRFPKLWGGVAVSTACNMAAIRGALGCDDSTPLSLLATVPPQHMYGMELSVLLPLIGGVAVHSGRPLFPADIAQALDELEPPRVLVATPVHLRAIVRVARSAFRRVDLVISATAPLDQRARSGGRTQARRASARNVRLHRNLRLCVTQDGGRSDLARL